MRLFFFLDELESKNILYPFLDVLKNRLNILDRTFEPEIISSLYIIEDYIIKNHKYYAQTPIHNIIKKLVDKSIVSYQTIYSYWGTSTNLLSDLLLFDHITKEKENLKYNTWINNEKYTNLKKIITKRIENFKEEYAEDYSYENYVEMFWSFRNLNKNNVDFDRNIFNDFFFNDFMIVALLHNTCLKTLKNLRDGFKATNEEANSIIEYLLKYQDIDSLSQNIENLDKSKDEYKDFIEELVFIFEKGKYLSLPHVIS